MPSEAEFLARKMCRLAGYDPDQLVVDIDPEKDFDFLYIRVAPVEIKKLKPMFVKFLDEAQRKVRKTESTQKRSGSAVTSS